MTGCSSADLFIFFGGSGSGSGSGDAKRMMMTMKKKKVSVVAAAAIIMSLIICAAEPAAAAAIDPGVSCPPIGRALASCNPFLFSPKHARPTQNCCAAAKLVDERAKRSSASDRSDICFCLTAVTQGAIQSHAAAVKAVCRLSYITFDPNNVC